MSFSTDIGPTTMSLYSLIGKLTAIKTGDIARHQKKQKIDRYIDT